MDLQLTRTYVSAYKMFGRSSVCPLTHLQEFKCNPMISTNGAVGLFFEVFQINANLEIRFRDFETILRK